MPTRTPPLLLGRSALSTLAVLGAAAASTRKTEPPFSPGPLLLVEDDHEALRRKADPVEDIDALRESGFLAELKETCERLHGRGLAAPQVGRSLQAFVFLFGTEMRVAINPEITRERGWTIELEGCLTFPGRRIRVGRPNIVTATFFTEDGVRRRYNLHGWDARCFQHEHDHLLGRLITDHERSTP